MAAVLTIATLLPDRLQGTGQSLYQTMAFGLAAIIADVGGGLVYGTQGYAAVFGLGGHRRTAGDDRRAGGPAPWPGAAGDRPTGRLSHGIGYNPDRHWRVAKR